MRVAKPSDDPVAFAAARREHAKQALAEAGLRGADLATTQLSGAADTMSMVGEGITRAKELGLGGASSTVGPEERKHLAAEVRAIRQQMVTYGNAQVAGSYVFGGYRDDVAPFEASGQFVGDGTVKELSTYPGLRVSASISGEEVFGVAGNEDVFSQLDALIGALESNDVAGIRSSVAGLDTSERRVVSAQAHVGSVMDGVEMARSVADRYSFSAKLEAARLTEADQMAAVTDLLRAKNALDAALATAQAMPTGGLIKSRS
jgi:flagellar hook-associated protein 3 FlgL